MGVILAVVHIVRHKAGQEHEEFHANLGLNSMCLLQSRPVLTVRAKVQTSTPELMDVPNPILHH